MSEFHMVVRFEAAPGKREELLSRLKTMEKATQSEPGCLYYILNVDRDDPNIFYFREAWSDREAHAVHDKTPHIEAFRALKDELTTSISASPTPTDTSWIPAGFTGTVTGDPNLVWKKTNTSGDPAYDKKWCSWLNCFYYRVAINENCSSVTGTLQELNALGEVEDSVQASSAGSLTPGQTATLVFEPSSEWSGSTKLASLGCLP